MIKYLLLILPLIALLQCKNYRSENVSGAMQDFNKITHKDTLLISHTSDLPIIDGEVDAVWENATWYPINQVWIPYGTAIDSTVFFGRYKLLWSQKTNLLYILAEITDNIFVAGYQYHPDPSKGQGYADYDILEIFIDENASRERHVFNATGEDAKLWGSNAESAFAYHIVIDTPSDGQLITEKRALDITGTSWSDYTIADYQDHIPEFAVKRNGNQYIWEFSLIVYDDTYDHENPELSRVELFESKVMGLSVAYCNNDQPDEEPKKRDHFIGSVWVPEENYNDHWKDASFFGTVKLTK